MRYLPKIAALAVGVALPKQVSGHELQNLQPIHFEVTSPCLAASSMTLLECSTNQVSIFDGYIPKSEHQAIIDGTSQFDATKAIQQAIDSISGTGKTLYFPPGQYFVSTVVVSGHDYKIATNGATFHQTPGLTGDSEVHPIIVIPEGAAGIELGNLHLVGNICSDEGEYSHGIAIISAHDIKIGDVLGENIRGDVLYAYGRTSNNSKELKNLKVGVVSGRNIYRSIVAIVGGEARIAGVRQLGPVGYRDLDIEPNNDGDYQPVFAEIGFIEGATVQITSDAIETKNQYVGIDRLDLDGRRLVNTIPPYPRYPGRNAVALSVNRTKVVEIGEFRLRNYESFPIVLADRWELVSIDKLEFEKSDSNEDTYKSLIIQIGNSGTGLLSIQSITGALEGPDRFLVRADLGLLRVHLGSVQVKGGLLGAYLTGKIDNLNLGIRDPIMRRCIGCSEFRILSEK